MNILKAVDLQKIYGQGETEVKALDGVNLEVEKGELSLIHIFRACRRKRRKRSKGRWTQWNRRRHRQKSGKH